MKIVDDKLWSMEECKVMAVMTIDLSVAFDTCDHSILLKVLQEKFGIKGKCLSWFDMYLRPRHCKVNIGSAYSSEYELKCSVPQGSCARTVAYLAYASTLQEVIPLDIPLYGYADDHSVKKAFRAGSQNKNEEKKTIEDLENGAKNIKTWIGINRLKMNDGKSEFAHNNLIFFGTSQMTEKFSLGWELNKTPLTFTESILTARPLRHLSVNVPPSKGLLFSYHCSHLLFWLRIPSSFTMFFQDALIDTNLIFFGSSQMTEKFSLGWELNPKPLTFLASTLIDRPLRHLSVTVPPSKGLLFSYHYRICSVWIKTTSGQMEI